MSHVWGTIPEREVHQGACVVPQFCSVLCVEEDEEPAPLVEKFTTRIQLLYLQLNIMLYTAVYSTAESCTAVYIPLQLSHELCLYSLHL